jgi:small-conductance mechanosensitive channel
MSEIWGFALDFFGQAVTRLQQPDQWWQISVIVIAIAFSWLSAHALRKYFDGTGKAGAGSALEIIATLSGRIAFSVLLGLIAVASGAVLQWAGLPHGLVSIVAILALTLAAIRLLIDVLKRVLQPGPLLAASEHLITWIAWLLVAMYLLGWIEPVATALDSVAIPIGKKGFSLLDAFKAILTMVVFLMVGGYLGTIATRGLMSSHEISIGLRVGIAKFVRLILLLIAGLLGLNAVGIDLAALAVFSGALGIGLGFGLQRIAANFVSGFILVGDRSIRQGDVITIGQRFGVVKELRARYIVVRDRDGVDTLIPNENVISSEVVNWSYGDRAIRLKLPVQISYQDDPRNALRLLLEAAARHPRVLKDPAPASRIMGFGDNGISLELRYWIRDPEDGINNVGSDLHLEIWDLFKAAGITIPYPQRDLHLRDGWPGGAPAPKE